LISFRYHLVSIVAVFLALSLGVLIGTTVVNQGVLNQIKDRADASAKRSRDLEKQVADLQAQLRDWTDFARSAEPLLVEGKLTGNEVVLVTQEGVGAADLDSVRRTLQEAGAKVLSELVITKRMALSDQTANAALAQALGSSPSPDPASLIETAAQQLAARLSDGPSSDPDLLDRLRTQGFLIIRGGGTLQEIGSTFQSVVFLVGGTDPSSLDPARFLQPLAASLVLSSKPVVAAETTEATPSLVTLIRNDDSMDGHLVTVDNADQIPGRVALVFGLRDLLASPGKGGDYGVKDGASSILPKP
jgi:hypothetical protein